MEGMNTNIMDINRILDEARNLGCSDLHSRSAAGGTSARLHQKALRIS